MRHGEGAGSCGLTPGHLPPSCVAWRVTTSAPIFSRIKWASRFPQRVTVGAEQVQELQACGTAGAPAGCRLNGLVPVCTRGLPSLPSERLSQSW